MIEKQDMQEQDQNLYLPIWDASKAAITSYMYCHDYIKHDENKQALICFENGISDYLSKDLRMIETVGEDLHKMAQSGRRMFFICPIHYRSIMTPSELSECVNALEQIPEAQRRYLIIMLVNFPDGIRQIDLLQHIQIIKKWCYGVYGHISGEANIGSYVMQKSGFDAIGFCIEQTLSERDLLLFLEEQGTIAVEKDVQNLFLLNVKSLSVASAAICAHYRFLAGEAIHDLVAYPDHIYRFENEHLFEGLIKSFGSTKTGDRNV